MLHESITAAVQRASRRWEGTRGRASQNSQLLQAIKTLLEVRNDLSSSFERLEDAPPQVVQECVKRWQAAKFSPSTINARLSVLGIMGVKTDGCWVKNKLPPKWWLKPDESSRLLAHLRATPSPFPTAPLLADYIEFISYTGLRVEEALRLKWTDLSLSVTEDRPGVLLSQSEMTVPGTKTRRSHATLALGVLPSLLLLKRQQMTGDELRVFPIKY
jgi:integrase